MRLLNEKMLHTPVWEKVLFGHHDEQAFTILQWKWIVMPVGALHGWDAQFCYLHRNLRLDSLVWKVTIGILTKPSSKLVSNAAWQPLAAMQQQFYHLGQSNCHLETTDIQMISFYHPSVHRSESQRTHVQISIRFFTPSQVTFIIFPWPHMVKKQVYCLYCQRYHHILKMLAYSL